MQMHSIIYEHTRNSRFRDAIQVFFQLISREFQIDFHLLPTIFKACAGLSALSVGRQVHSVAVTSGYGSDSFISGSMLHMYLKCDQVDDARKLFDEMQNYDVVSSAALLSGYAQKGKTEDAKRLLSKIRESGFELNDVAWNGLIAGFNRSKKYGDAIMAFKEMHSAGVEIGGVSISSVLPSVGYAGILNMGDQIHCHVVKRGMKNCNWVGSALIDMYGRCSTCMEIQKVFEEMNTVDVVACNAFLTGLARMGSVNVALQKFREFQHQGFNLNIVSWTSVISACSQNGNDAEALEIFREMQDQGEKPNEVTITSVLPACGNISALKQGMSIHGFSIRSGILHDIHVDSSLVDMYAKCGRMHFSRRCFERMIAKNKVSWNAIINGYSMHGEYKEAVDLFDLMKKNGLKPDAITFTSLLSVCAHCGLYDEGIHFFNSMSRDYGIDARMEHYASMVNLLGRCGRLLEAYAMINEMPFEADGCVWGSFLNACRVHRNIELGVEAAEKLFALEPENPGNYVLLANLYASKGMWEEANKIRDKLVSTSLSKNPGCSWIELNNEIYTLLSGDNSRPEMLQINEKLGNLNDEMKNSENSDAFNDVERQDVSSVLGLLQAANLSCKDYEDAWLS